MARTIIFKTRSFPTISETFIVTNIIETIKKGYDVKILVDIINSKSNSSQPELLKLFGLMDKVVIFNSPVKKKERILKALGKLLNPIVLIYFFKYCAIKKKKSLEYIFILSHYFKLRDAKNFHVHFGTAINPLLDLKKIGFLKSKIIVTFHGYDAHFLPIGKQLEVLVNDYNNYVSHITVNSRYLKNILIQKGFSSHNIKIVPIGINTEIFCTTSGNIKEIVPFKIVTVGRLIELKGHALGIQVMSILKDRGYAISYSIVGEGEELKKLKELVTKLDLNDIIHFYGSKNQEEIKELLKEFHLFLMPSTKDKNLRQEAFGVVSLEAQAMGLPVVGFKSGGFPETLIEGKTGITVADKDVIALADVIVELIANKKKLAEMSLAAKNNVKENFDATLKTLNYIDL